MSREDAAFYTYSHGAEVLWVSSEDNPKQVRVYRNGEMRIHYKEKSGAVSVLRYTQDLDEKGLDTDEKLFGAEKSGLIEWIDNPWFEVAWTDNEDGEVIGTFCEAVDYAKRVMKEEES